MIGGENPDCLIQFYKSFFTGQPINYNLLYGLSNLDISEETIEKLFKRTIINDKITSKPDAHFKQTTFIRLLPLFCVLPRDIISKIITKLVKLNNFDFHRNQLHSQVKIFDEIIYQKRLEKLVKSKTDEDKIEN